MTCRVRKVRDTKNCTHTGDQLFKDKNYFKKSKRARDYICQASVVTKVTKAPKLYEICDFHQINMNKVVKIKKLKILSCIDEILVDVLARG